MKVRIGFVSNSSTSSYIIVTTKEKFDRVMAECHPYVRAVVKAVGAEEHKLGKENVVLLSYSSGNYSTFEYLDVPFHGDIPEDYEYPGDAMDEFESKLKCGRIESEPDVIYHRDYY